MTQLEGHLRRRLEAGSKLLVPYVVAGIPSRDLMRDVLRSLADTGDAIEIGLPYSDPVMDGPLIAAAAQRAIAGGVGPLDALSLGEDAGIPRVAMTYYNPIHRLGEAEFCLRLTGSGFAGLIVPDLPFEESTSLRRACADYGIAWIPLVAPTSPDDRVRALTETATGFVYAVSTLGVTGVRATLSERAERVVGACRAYTDLPVLVGIGVSTPEQAVEACAWADGVVVGTAVVRLLIEEGIAAAGEFLTGVRRGLDGLAESRSAPRSA
ncbi:MAG: tryptophan synthase subunit alpha [Actinomycetota bacterium]